MMVLHNTHKPRDTVMDYVACSAHDRQSTLYTSVQILIVQYTLVSQVVVLIIVTNYS